MCIHLELADRKIGVGLGFREAPARWCTMLRFAGATGSLVRIGGFIFRCIIQSNPMRRLLSSSGGAARDYKVFLAVPATTRMSEEGVPSGR